MTKPAATLPPARPGGPSRVIQGSFPGGRPSALRAAASPILPKAAARPGPIPAPAPRPVAVQPSGGNAFALPPGFQLRPSALGQRLPEAVQQKMESFFGASFADVRVHIGHEAASIGALAFTIGTDLYFAPGQYNPQTMQGQQLLGHELTHVVQQRAGRVKNPMGSGMAVVQDPGLEAEAERMGMRAAMAPAPIQAKPAGASPVVPRPVGTPIVPGISPGAAQPRRPGLAPASPIPPVRSAGVSPLQARGGVAPARVPVEVSPPSRVGGDSYRIVAGAAGQPVGSVMVHARGNSTIEVTDLKVDGPHRGRGLGEKLMASAMRTGLQMGRGRVVLASQDDGSGRLTQWYRRMGFEPAGVNSLGYAELQAPIGRVLAGATQARMAPSPPVGPRGGRRPGAVQRMIVRSRYWHCGVCNQDFDSGFVGDAPGYCTTCGTPTNATGNAPAQAPVHAPVAVAVADFSEASANAMGYHADNGRYQDIRKNYDRRGGGGAHKPKDTCYFRGNFAISLDRDEHGGQHWKGFVSTPTGWQYTGTYDAGLRGIRGTQDKKFYSNLPREGE